MQFFVDERCELTTAGVESVMARIANTIDTPLKQLVHIIGWFNNEHTHIYLHTHVQTAMTTSHLPSYIHTTTEGRS